MMRTIIRKEAANVFFIVYQSILIKRIAVGVYRRWCFVNVYNVTEIGKVGTYFTYKNELNIFHTLLV